MSFRENDTLPYVTEKNLILFPDRDLKGWKLYPLRGWREL